jgi:hypothetical protein
MDKTIVRRFKMIRIEKMAGMVSVSLSWGGVVGAVTLPLSVERESWNVFALALASDIEYSECINRRETEAMGRRVMLSGCPDENRVYGYLKSNPCVFQAILCLFRAGKIQNEKNTQEGFKTVGVVSQELCNGQGVEQDGGHCLPGQGKDTDGGSGVGQGVEQNGGHCLPGQGKDTDGGSGARQQATRPGLGTLAWVVGKWEDISYLRSRTPFGGTTSITTDKRVRKALVVALPGELICLVPNHRDDATPMHCMFTKDRIEGLNLTQEEVTLLGDVISELAYCTGDSMDFRMFEAFRRGAHKRRESLQSASYNNMNWTREREVFALFNGLMEKTWDYAVGIIPFD